MQTDFAMTVRRYQGMVFSLALRIVRDRGLAEEVAQDVFLKLHGEGTRFQSPEHVEAWLRRVASHRAIDAVRRRMARVEGTAVEFEEEIWAPEATGAAPALALRVERLLNGLPPDQRAALTLRYQEDLGPEQIAEVLGMPVATVKSHLRRGLALLRRKAAEMELSHGSF